jgi:hypothetical protein
MKVSDHYLDGTSLPRLHPDDAINSSELIAALCAKLDTARDTLTKVLDMNVVSPAGLAMKRDVRWALTETHPNTLHEEHANCG